MRQFFFMILLIWITQPCLAQLSLGEVIHNFERQKDTVLSSCFKERLDSVYCCVGSPMIGIDAKGSRFFPGKVFIKDSCALFFLVEELAHSWQWEKQRGGKFRMTVALGGLVLKATWRTIFWGKAENSTSDRKSRIWQHYSELAYEDMPCRFWAFEYEAHEIIAPKIWYYLTCKKPLTPMRE